MHEQDLIVERREDMSTVGLLRLLRQNDGDMCLYIMDEDGKTAGVEFCTYSGGGRSTNTWKALHQLAHAMAVDNRDEPAHIGEFPGEGYLHWVPFAASPSPDLQGELVAAATKADALLQKLLQDDSALQFEVWPVLGELQCVLAKVPENTKTKE